MKEYMEIAWIILLYVILIPLIFSYILSKITKDDILSTLGAILISMVTFIVFSFLNLNFREFEYAYNHEIVTIQDSETMIVSRHSAEGEMYYYYMIKDGDQYRSKKSHQNLSTLKYTDDQPIVEVYKKESTSKFIYFFMPINTYVDDYRYDFYIPNGTIKEDFNVDLN